MGKKKKKASGTVIRDRKERWSGSAEQRDIGDHREIHGDLRWLRGRGGFSPETKAHLCLSGRGFSGSALPPLPTAKRQQCVHPPIPAKWGGSVPVFPVPVKVMEGFWGAEHMTAVSPKSNVPF